MAKKQSCTILKEKMRKPGIAMEKFRPVRVELISPRNGFSLIELMIAIAVIGVLTALAWPSYQNHIARTQVAEAVMYAGGARINLTNLCMDKGGVMPLTLSEFFSQTGGSFPVTYADNPTRYISRVQFYHMGQIPYTNGDPHMGGAELDITMSSNAHSSISGKSFSLISFDCGKHWTCSNKKSSWYGPDPANAIQDEFMPSSCKNSLAEINALPGY